MRTRSLKSSQSHCPKFTAVLYNSHLAEFSSPSYSIYNTITLSQMQTSRAMVRRNTQSVNHLTGFFFLLVLQPHILKFVVKTG